jgi:hypothetical protein
MSTLATRAGPCGPLHACACGCGRGDLYDHAGMRMPMRIYMMHTFPCMHACRCRMCMCGYACVFMCMCMCTRAPACGFVPGRCARGLAHGRYACLGDCALADGSAARCAYAHTPTRANVHARLIASTCGCAARSCAGSYRRRDGRMRTRTACTARTHANAQARRRYHGPLHVRGRARVCSGNACTCTRTSDSTCFTG